ncbi:hypothetical protein [Bacillus mycoides]|uniref:hypothetical protein n=1 Tax=Bacillus mycoides TaxID=1405 RepID=UPI003D07161E
MKRILCRLIAMLLLIPFILVPSNAKAAVQNQKDPIILIHGLAGWGREEVPGFKYWGGFKDIEAHFNQQGYQTYRGSETVRALVRQIIYIKWKKPTISK